MVPTTPQSASSNRNQTMLEAQGDHYPILALHLPIILSELTMEPQQIFALACCGKPHFTFLNSNDAVLGFLNGKSLYLSDLIELVKKGEKREKKQEAHKTGKEEKEETQKEEEEMVVREAIGIYMQHFAKAPIEKVASLALLFDCCLNTPNNGCCWVQVRIRRQHSSKCERPSIILTLRRLNRRPSTTAHHGIYVVDINKRVVVTQNKRNALTKSQIEYSILLASGESDSDITKKRFISTDTARKHRRNVLEKLCLRNKQELMQYMRFMNLFYD